MAGEEVKGCLADKGEEGDESPFVYYLVGVAVNCTPWLPPFLATDCLFRFRKA